MKIEQERWDQDWVVYHREEWLSDLIELIKIPSISQKCRPDCEYPFGKECARALDTALKMARNVGLQTECCQYYCGTAFLPGTDPDCGELGIFVHLDVVPPGSGWMYSPFEAVVEGDLVVGRGSRDNKGAAVATLYAVRGLLEQGIRLRHGIRFFFGCNEELGMEDVTYFLKGHEAPVFSLVPDSPFPVCYGEKGVIEMEIWRERSGKEPVMQKLSGGAASNQVPESAEAILRPAWNWIPEPAEGISVFEEKGSYRVIARGRAAHSAYPEGSDNAVVKLAGYLTGAGVLTEEEEQWMIFVKQYFSDYYGEALDIVCRDQLGEKLTCVLGMASVTKEGFWGNINIRYPYSAEGTRLIGRLREILWKQGFSVKRATDNPGCCLDRSHPAIDRLNEIACRRLGLDLPPYVAKGGTYARKINGPAVGYGPNCPGPHPFGPGRGTGHLPDEAISIKGVEAAMTVYAEALMALDELFH